MDNVLTAREGYVYTNGETFSTVIRLGVNDSADNWHEITEEEAERLQSEEAPEIDEPTEADYINALNEKEQIINILTGE
jgi:hypothetical protein